MLNQTPIGSGIGRLETKNTERITMGQGLKQAFNSIGGNERRIAIQDHDIALEAIQRREATAHGMASPERRILNGNTGAAKARLDMCCNGGRPGARHHNNGRTPDRFRQRDRPVQHGPSGHLMQDLGPARFHPRALTRCKYDGRPLAHGIPPRALCWSRVNHVGTGFDPQSEEPA